MVSKEERKRIRNERRRFTRRKTREDASNVFDRGYSGLPYDQKERFVNTVDRADRIRNRVGKVIGDKTEKGREQIKDSLKKRFKGGFNVIMGFKDMSEKRKKGS